MRKKLVLAAVLGLLLALGAIAAYLLAFQSKPSGKIDTQLKGITLVPSKPATPKRAKPKPKKAPLIAVDKPCWLNFGGDPARTLARVNINLGRPTKPLWARGLGGYIEYAPSYCNGT